MSSERIDATRRAQLEEERDFLMKSLDDLELEQESGGIDDESYAALHDDYTARLAATLRSLRDDIDVAPKPSPRPKRNVRRRVVLIVAVAAFAVLAGVSLAYAVGARLPGQMGSGDSQSTSQSATDKATLAKLKQQITTLQQQVNKSPDDYDLRLQLSLAYERNSDVINALKQSDAAISIDGNRPEGHANSARLLYLISSQLPDKTAQQQYISQALAGFDKAIEVGPDYADSYFFRGVLYTGALQDYARAQIDLQNYLLKDPTGRWADKARTLLAQVSKALATPSTTTVPATTTTPKKK